MHFNINIVKGGFLGQRPDWKELHFLLQTGQECQMGLEFSLLLSLNITY